nr:hypothetical protein [uncultured Romboutsia sp.]
MVLVRAKTYINTMTIDIIRNKNKNIIHFLLSAMIFVLISKSYFYFIYVVNLKSNIPANLNFLFVWSFRILLLSLVLFIRWNLYDILLFIIGLAISMFTGNSMILAFFVMGIYCRNNSISNDYLVKNYLFITATFFFALILLNALKLIPNGQLHYRGNTPRNDFGFGNPNSPFLACLPLYAGYIYLRFDDYDNYDRALLIVVSLIIYFQTYSRTGLITIFAILLFIEILKRINIVKNRFMSYLIILIPILITLFSFFTGMFLNNDFFNEILSHRPEAWNVYIQNIKLLGNSNYYTIRNTYPLDNSYLYSFVIYGVLFTISLIGIYTYYIYKNVIDNNSKIIAICSIFLIYSFGENILLNINLNFTLILVLSSISLEKIHHYLKNRI